MKIKIIVVLGIFFISLLALSTFKPGFIGMVGTVYKINPTPDTVNHAPVIISFYPINIKETIGKEEEVMFFVVYQDPEADDVDVEWYKDGKFVSNKDYYKFKEDNLGKFNVSVFLSDKMLSTSMSWDINIGEKKKCVGECCFIECEDSTVVCPDGYKSRCKNTCDPKTKQCTSCQPLCFKYPSEVNLSEGFYREYEGLLSGDEISRRTVPCISVSDIEKEIVEIREEALEDLNEIYDIPKGYSIILKPFSLECNGDISLTVSIPDDFIDVKALKCRKNECNPSKIYNVVSLECGGEFVKEISREEDYLDPKLMPINLTPTKLDLSEYKNSLKSGENEIKFYGDIFENLSVIMSMPSEPIKEAENPTLKIVGTPLIIKLNKIDVLLNSTITMQYFEEEHIEKDSYAVYAKKKKIWNYIGGDINSENKTISADINDVASYADENNEVVFSVMGILCTDCLNSSFNLVYNNGRDAIVLVHGFMSSPDTYKELIDDIILTQQPFQIWTFGYPTTRDIKKNAEELAFFLEANKDNYEDVYIIGHSLGGMIVQQALFFSNNSNMEYLEKVKKVILIGTPNEGSPTVNVYKNLINRIANLGKYKAYDTRNITKDLIEGVITPKIKHIDYYVIAGTKSYIFTSDLFNITNDGVISIKSAQHVGDSYIDDKCKNYWEIEKTHTDLIDDILPRRIIEKIINEEFLKKNVNSDFGNNNYFELKDRCSADDKYIFIGQKIEKEAIEDPTGCSCGNGICGIGEDNISCPGDCAKFSKSLKYIFYLVIIIIASSVVHILKKKKKERKEEKKWNEEKKERKEKLAEYQNKILKEKKDKEREGKYFKILK